MGDLIRIVESISATPVVLFDLNVDGGVCGVSGFSAPPPQLVRSSVQTQLRDGSTDAGSVYGDRSIEIDLDLYATSQDSSATYLQKLGRLLSDPRGQWLMYQPTGASKPVFFRTKRADIESIEDVLSSKALRELDLSIPAEPFAYGLPVTGTVTIANNPSAATNPMSCTFTDVQGDVPTPLVVRATDGIAGCMLALHAGPVPQNPWPRGKPQVTNPPLAGWTMSAADDTNAVDGSVARMVNNSGATAWAQTQFSGTNIGTGDYRVVARVKASAAGSKLRVYPNRYATAAVVRDLNVGAYAWHDFGVMRLDTVAPQSVPPAIFLTEEGTASLWVEAAAPVGGSVSIDRIALVPAGLDASVSASLLLGGGSAAYAGYVDIDSLGESMFIAVGGTGRTIPFAGGLPRLTPGFTNRLHLIRSLATNPAPTDVLTVSTDLEYLYYPLYLYVRPATS
jgi:hypothetical protein